MMRKIVCIIFVSIIFFIGFLFADFFNIGEILDLDFSRLNWEFLSLIVNNLILIVLYVVTYIVIDRKNVVRSNNQEQSAKRYLKTIYNQCNNFIDLLDMEDARELMTSRCDFNKPVNDNPILNNLCDLPFELEHHVLEASNNGILSDADLSRFLDIRVRYKNYIQFRIIFFNIEEHEDNPKTSVYGKLEIQYGIQSPERPFPAN